MGAWTLEVARNHLNAWLEAEIAVSTGQSYQIGSRQLQRANLGQIKEQIRFWKNEVEKLERKSRRGGTNRVMGVIPRDF
ncbi:DUF6148 family protein [Clostridium cylindrosporum]|uniref:Uncharacterized protein n=1 Tax=Clostridium cylindrosporum DSM 605 TaxID=1121307 RepID=A0A0J8DFP5_CLOCY|nr:DUF6148 family protein [Clostridium cylindrosporum]KMT22998.1 hypothetical protein CLCY_7c00450 [Clostridium cylindrosporum DSM 605]